MDKFRIIRKDQWRTQPWKNGKGSSSEICLDPPGNDFTKLEFQWRFSTAPVVEAGPFSKFPGYQRMITLLEGSELLLFIETKPPLSVNSGMIHRFSGDENVRCELPQGPVRDLNFIYRADSISPSFQFLTTHQQRWNLVTEKTVLLFVLEGELRLKGEDSAVAKWDTVLLHQSKVTLESSDSVLLKIEF